MGIKYKLKLKDLKFEYLKEYFIPFLKYFKKTKKIENYSDISFLKNIRNQHDTEKANEIYFEILDNELQKNEMPKEIYENAKKNFLERYEKINWNEYHESLPFNTSALSLYEWSPIAEELKSLDKKIVLNSMILKWDNVKKEFIELINF